ncbi:hypothetical protein BS47DRAFT_698927 [Hydnum rufescens UP504]|uniref:Uncharacterized protein n=1 Tax=Hydnum rufescens UP504 TaxID=1448309 RepID=A0A9P6AFG6_9AGAM|nr:hypothetical protein BS47DRAFT_698927 [Hydnum rufescens UP504]
MHTAYRSGDKFLESFVGGLKGNNTLDNTAIASSLFFLKGYASQFPWTISRVKYISFGYRNLMAIRADAKRWSSLNVWRSYIQRDQIITAISRHEVNLTDCLHTFQIVTLASITASNRVDRVGTIASPVPSVSARPPLASENAPECATCSNSRR